MRVCACHGVPVAKPRGCRVTKRERDRRHLLTDKGRARVRRFRLREHLSRTDAALNRRTEEYTSRSTQRRPMQTSLGTTSVAKSSTA